MNRLEGKVAIVTGGNSGVGAATAMLFAKEGAKVVISARRQTQLEEVAGKIRAEGGEVLPVVCDISKHEDAKHLMAEAVKAYGKVDILVNNAGITRDNLVMRMSEEDFDAVIAANLKGTFLCMKAVSRLMLKQRYGRIVNLSSVVGLRGNAGQVNYAASKAGVIGMTKSMAKELASRGITVNAVAPGFIETDMTAAMTDAARTAAQSSIPMGRLGKAEDVAKAVVFLASDSAAYITGQVLAAVGGMAM